MAFANADCLAIIVNCMEFPAITTIRVFGNSGGNSSDHQGKLHNYKSTSPHEQ